MPRMSRRRLTLAFAVVLWVADAAGATPPDSRGLSLGIALDGLALPVALAAKDPAHPIDVLVCADWSDVETAPGVFDWSAIETTAATLVGRGARVTLRVRGDSALHPRIAGERGVPDGVWLQAWTALLRSAVATLGAEVATVEVGEIGRASCRERVYVLV